MKQPNWRLFFLLNKIEIGAYIVILIGVIIILLYDDASPAFKYSNIVSKTTNMGLSNFITFGTIKYFV